MIKTISETPTRQKRRMHTIRVVFDRPPNPSFGHKIYDPDIVAFVWDEDRRDYKRDENSLLVDPIRMRHYVIDCIRHWRQENEANRAGGEPASERLVPDHWDLADIKITMSRPMGKKIIVNLIYGEPIFYYMVLSDWTSAIGDNIPHADRNIFEERALAEEDAKKANDSPWTNGGRRGFYVSEIAVKEAGDPWPSYFDGEAWARGKEQS